MDKISKKILKHMNNAEPDPANKFYSWGADLDDLASSIGETEEATRAAIRHLEEEKYIIYCKNQNGRSIGFSLDHNGLHYKEHNRKRSAEKRRDSIWIPLLVSFLSGVLLDRAVQALSSWIRALTG